MLNNNVSTSQVVATVIAIPVVYYLLFKWKPRYFKKHGVKGPFRWPLVGNSLPVLRHGVLEANKGWTREYGKIAGVFEGNQPVLLISDPDLLQQILIKDFYIFTDRKPLFSGDPIIDNFLTVLKGDHWRHVRHLLSPTFSSGKLKRMSADMNTCAVLLVENLTKIANEGTVINLKDRCGEFTLDVIARTHFGIEIDTQKNPNSPFVRYTKKLFTPSWRTAVFLLLPFLRPLMRYMQISIFPTDTISFLKDVVLKAIEERQHAKDGSRTDFLQLMLNARNDQPDEDGEVYKASNATTNTANHSTGHKSERSSTNTWDKKGLSESEILAQAVLFLLAGYESTAATLSYVAYNLALNPECQEKLFSEVESVVGDKEIVDFDMTHNLTYMDQCISETLRLFPASIRTDRLATNDTSIAGFPVHKGTCVGVQIYAIHHDPDLWPDPDKFDPERFTAEAVATHHPMQYLPFGQGPRMCIGMKLALMEIKVALAHMIKRFRIVRCPETDVPLQFTKFGLLQAKNGIKVKLEIRSSNSLLPTAHAYVIEKTEC